MNTFRTTINFDQTLHRQLSLDAAVRGISLSELVNQILSNRNLLCPDDAKASLNDSLVSFRTLAKKSCKVNWLKALRDERDRDHA